MENTTEAPPIIISVKAPGVEPQVFEFTDRDNAKQFLVECDSQGWEYIFTPTDLLKEES